MINTLKNVYTSALMTSAFYVGSVHAVDIKVPDFVAKVTPESLNKAGGSVWPWVLGAFVAIIVIAAAFPAFNAINGDREKAKQQALNILYGAGLFVVLPAIAVAVIKAM